MHVQRSTGQIVRVLGCSSLPSMRRPTDYIFFGRKEVFIQPLEADHAKVNSTCATVKSTLRSPSQRAWRTAESSKLEKKERHCVGSAAAAAPAGTAAPRLLQEQREAPAPPVAPIWPTQSHSNNACSEGYSQFFYWRRQSLEMWPLLQSYAQAALHFSSW